MQARRWVGVAIEIGLLSDGWAAQARTGLAKPVAAERASAGACREIEGTAARGESVRRTFAAGLDFMLEAVPNGWVIRVLPTGRERPPLDFAEVATPPFRSINPLLLTTDFGFRSQDAVGWNPRTFRYVGRRAEFEAAERAFRAVTASAHPSAAEEMAVGRVAEQAFEGRFEILDAELAPGFGNQTAAAGLVASHFATTAHTIRSPEGGGTSGPGTILSLRFHVTLSAPGAKSCDLTAKPVRKH